MKKNLVLFLAIIISCLFIFSSCFLIKNKEGDDETEEQGTEGLHYTLLNDGTYSVSIGAANESSEIIIPSKYNSKAVTSIGDGAFERCTSLTSVTIGDSVTSIGEYAFSGCKSLTSVTIPDSVTSIGNYAFSYCTNLTSIIVDENNPNYISIAGNLYTKDRKTLIQYAIGNENTAFVISDSVTSIGSSAFEGCTGLTSITIPDSVTSIGSSAFGGCKSLTYNEYDNACYIGNKDNPYLVLVKAKDKSITSCTINENTKFIHSNAFSVCTSLTSITIPDSVTSIGNSAFYDCDNLTSIIVPNSVTSIGNYAFSGCKSLTSINIPDSVTIIGNGAFAYCKSLTSITIPSSVTSIGDAAFSGCKSLTSITIPESVTNIGDDAFGFCSSLTSITIPDSVTSIGEEAFAECKSLTSITIPNSVTSIGYMAFANCPALTYNEYDNACYIGNKDNPYLVLVKVKDESITSCTINENTKIICEYVFFWCTTLQNINVEKNNATYKSIDGNLYTKDGKTLIQYAASKQDTSFVIPNSVTSIGDEAFNNCTNLTNINIPNSVTSIGSSAFSYCTSLTSITIPDSVTSIGGGAFGYCTNLTSVTIGEGVTSIGIHAFSDCTSLANIKVDENNPNYTSIDGNLYSKDVNTLIRYISCKQDAYFVIPDTVTSIVSGAFDECTNLTSVIIPDSVTSMGNGAFGNCTNLTIYCKATTEPRGWSEDWNLLGGVVYWYSEEEPTTSGNYWHYVDGVVTKW